MTITADTATTGAINWAKIVTTGAAAVSAYFELRDGATNILYNRTGIAGSSATMSKFVIPRVRNVASGLDVGFAIVNTGASRGKYHFDSQGSGWSDSGRPNVQPCGRRPHVWISVPTSCSRPGMFPMPGQRTIRHELRLYGV